MVETGRAVGALMAISRDAIDAAGLLDDDLFAYVEDVDWALRVRAAGFEIVFAPGARAWHSVSASTGGEKASTHTLYYGVRNTVTVLERRRPLGKLATQRCAGPRCSPRSRCTRSAAPIVGRRCTRCARASPTHATAGSASGRRSTERS